MLDAAGSSCSDNERIGMGRRFVGFTAAMTMVSLLALPGMAAASTSEAIADTGGMTLTLGVVGSPLDVGVTLDEIGHITEVSVGDQFTEEQASDHKVRFTSEDGTTRIDVRAKRDRLAASVKTDNLAGITGSHTWTGKLFGSDTDSVVTFDVLDNGGSPEIANVAVASLSPTDATYEIGDVKTKTEGDESGSKVTVTFTRDGYTMTLQIKAEVELDDHDGNFEAKLKVELRGRDVQRLREQNLPDLIGSHSWDGRLCDGTPVGVAYTISEGGSVTVDAVTLAGAMTDAFDLKEMPHGFVVTFDDSRAKLTVELKEKEPGLWDLKVKSKTTETCDAGDGWDRGDHDHNDDGRGNDHSHRDGNDNSDHQNDHGEDHGGRRGNN